MGVKIASKGNEYEISWNKMQEISNFITMKEVEVDEELIKKYKSRPYESIENIRKMMRENYIGA